MSFSVGDLVLAKQPGFPLWLGIVDSFDEKGKIVIQWFNKTISKPLAQRNVQVLTHESLVKFQKNKVPLVLLSEQQSDSSQVFNLLNSETKNDSPFTTPPDTPTTSTSVEKQIENGGQAPIAPWSLDTESVPAQESQSSLSEPKGVQAEGAGSPELDTDKEIEDELWETIRPTQHSTTMDRSTLVFRSLSEKPYAEAKPRAQPSTNQKKTKSLAKQPTKTIRPAQHSTAMDRSTSIFSSLSEKSYAEAKPRAQPSTNQKKTKTLAKLPTNEKQVSDSFHFLQQRQDFDFLEECLKKNGLWDNFLIYRDSKGKQCTVKGEEFILSLDEMLKAPAKAHGIDTQTWQAFLCRSAGWFANVRMQEAKREGKGVAYHASGRKVRSDSKCA
ncbi:hypothetical protein BDP27DRAFT_1367216 [Rhodocollybia butyracea]|uniref:Uncharacterized protein n=1 Tax=Rhodocollybia butyracea TaxID=206335 RepID=A0A9P5PJA5_9AGAR|nr:hypothetical protein BDP27DRAFT_1367216 [Rhodocollybia butyracea]